jgi:hypothetical protein
MEFSPETTLALLIFLPALAGAILTSFIRPPSDEA